MRETFNVANLIRPDLEKLIPYDAHLYPDVIKLDANENPFPFPEEIARQLGSLVAGELVTRYPDSEATELRKAIAQYCQVSPEQVMAGNGSDELILNILLTFGTDGRVIITNPTFSMYKIHAMIAGARVIPSPRRGDFSVDVPALISYARKPETRVVFICSPNNPTGNSSTLEEIEGILQQVSSLVVVDQAYLEFGGEDFTPLLNKYPNLVILRTFSKAFALAGLRVGYMLAHPDVLRQIKKVKQPFNLNSFSQAAVKVILEHTALFQEQIKAIKEQREQVYRQLQGLEGVTPFPSLANYILFRTNYSSKVIYQGLLEKGVLIRKLGGPELPGFLRVSVGTLEQNKIFIEALAEVLDQLREACQDAK
ncbi:histidinol-phosphate transaminase [Desulfotomaculum sp. 1211_IL3151]|uniref:histidinol-phosphate transaminase n=1 Tax=Desulfotomaculum sp. 1211_IL3151 TaxID=3084055 RepID=UPI002FD9428E